METIHIYWHNGNEQSFVCSAMLSSERYLPPQAWLTKIPMEANGAINAAIKQGHNSVQWPGGHYLWEIKSN
jgi:hypothetical protein